MRAFWALEVSDEARAALAAASDALRAAAPRAPVTWVRPESLHLTLKFLGEVADEGPLVAAARPVAAAAAPLDLCLDGLGSFGGRRPRVVWAGLGGAGVAPLAALARALEDAHAALGFAREARPFRAHLTLGRVRDRRGRGHRPGADDTGPLVAALERVALDPVAFRASEVVLFESSLGHGGPVRYTPRARLALGG